MNKQTVYQQLGTLFCETMPFTRLLGFQMNQLSGEYAELSFDWQDNLIGNPIQQILHGGVTATALDTVGGMLVAASIVDTMEDLSEQALQARLANLGSIDIRTDYLRPGRGERFIASSHLIRSGNKLSVCRMELHNEKGIQIAYGTGTYLTSA